MTFSITNIKCHEWWQFNQIARYSHILKGNGCGQIIRTYITCNKDSYTSNLHPFVTTGGSSGTAAAATIGHAYYGLTAIAFTLLLNLPKTKEEV